MDKSEPKRVVEAFYERSNVGDLDGVLDLLDDGIRWTNVGSTQFSMTCENKQELVEKLFGPVFGALEAGIRSTIHNMIGEGELVAVQVDGEARTKAGVPYNNTYCHIFRVRNGKIVEATEYFDTALVNSVFGQ
jgi:ketosteroid isomerase-like protein